MNLPELLERREVLLAELQKLERLIKDAYECSDAVPDEAVRDASSDEDVSEAVPVRVFNERMPLWSELDEARARANKKPE